MRIEKTMNVLDAITMTWKHIVSLLVLMGGVATLYYFNVISFTIPWLPLSVIGTAVAFFVGFKNNQSYDRTWEARKIWGGIVNDSRTWGMMVDGFVSNLYAERKASDEEIRRIKKRLVYRHIGWLYTHRSQLLIPAPWEHASQDGHVGRRAKRYQEQFGIGLLGDEVTRTELKLFLMEEEHDRLIGHANTATQIINEQSRDLQELRERGLIDDFRHMEMVKLLSNFYTLQGKNERIKKFPLPRQYANLGQYFVGIFILLLPFSMIPAMVGEAGTLWDYATTVPIVALVGWVYIMMDNVGDYSENPFQGMANDIPMLSLCRVIEIDLREMLGETDLPPAVKANNGVLM